MAGFSLSYWRGPFGGPPGLTMPSRCCWGPGQLSSRSDRVITAAAAFGAISHGQSICTATSNALLGVSTGPTLIALPAGEQEALVRWDADPRCSMPMLRIFLADTASERCFALVSALEALLDLVPPLNRDCSVCHCHCVYADWPTGEQHELFSVRFPKGLPDSFGKCQQTLRAALAALLKDWQIVLPLLPEQHACASMTASAAGVCTCSKQDMCIWLGAELPSGLSSHSHTWTGKA